MSAELLPRLLSTTEVCERLRISRVSLWSWRKSGRFPQPYVVLGERSMRWREADVLAFLESKAVPR